MKIWVDDVREAPEGYVWCKSTNEALRTITSNRDIIEIIDLDHDAGDYAKIGGDFINVLNELERLSKGSTPSNREFWSVKCKQILFRLHSRNPVGVQNMRSIIERNGWKEIWDVVSK